MLPQGAPSPGSGGGGAFVFEASGATWEALFEDVAARVAARLVDPATVSPGGLRDRWRAEGAGPADLLARWAREVAYQVAVNRVVPARVAVRRAHLPEKGPCVVEAEVDGELLDPSRHDVLREVRALDASATTGCADGRRTASVHLTFW